MKTNPNAVRPKALFIISDISILSFYGTTITRMVHMLALIDIDIYGSKELQGYVGKFNDDVINDPVDGTLYDILIFDPTDLSSLSSAKPEAFIITLMQGDNSINLIHLLKNIIAILIRQQQDNYDPDEIIQINPDLLSGIAKQENRSVSACAIQLKYVLRLTANTIIDLLRKVRHRSILFDLALQDINSEAYQNYLGMGKGEILVPWIDYDQVEPPADASPACWDCERLRMKDCALAYKPELDSSGHCAQRQTNARIEYGDSPEKRAAMIDLLDSSTSC